MTLASGSEDNTAILWDVGSSTQKARLRGAHWRCPLGIVFTHRAVLATASADKSIKIWTSPREPSSQH